MIENKIVPNMNIFSNINQVGRIDDFSMKGFGTSALKESNGADFKTVLSGLVSNLNTEIQKPDQLMNQHFDAVPHIIRDEEDLQNLEFAFIEFQKALQKKFNTKIFSFIFLLIIIYKYFVSFYNIV